MLFIDQPSQVYFPKATGIIRSSDKVTNNKEVNADEEDFDENIKQVKNIFKVIEEEINNIESEYDFKPQVVVMEHADEAEFSQYVKKRWSVKGEKLI